MDQHTAELAREHSFIVRCRSTYVCGMLKSPAVFLRRSKEYAAAYSNDNAFLNRGMESETHAGPLAGALGGNITKIALANATSAKCESPLDSPSRCKTQRGAVRVLGIGRFMPSLARECKGGGPN